MRGKMAADQQTDAANARGEQHLGADATGTQETDAANARGEQHLGADATGTQEAYDAQRRWLHQMKRSTISALSEAFGGLTGPVAVRSRSVAFYQECICSVANDELNFSTGLHLSLGDVLEVEADLLDYEIKLTTAHGTVVRVRTMSKEAMQMWMRVLPPSEYRNEHKKYAIERNQAPAQVAHSARGRKREANTREASGPGWGLSLRHSLVRAQGAVA